METTMPTRGEFTDDMGEISGFGGSYEAGCRAMLKAGVAWIDAHPDADLQFGGFRNVYGLLMDESADARALTRAVMDAAFTDPETGKVTTAGEYGATGAMHQAVISHVLFIRKNGWEKYVTELRTREREEQADR